MPNLSFENWLLRAFLAVVYIHTQKELKARRAGNITMYGQLKPMTLVSSIKLACIKHHLEHFTSCLNIWDTTVWTFSKVIWVKVVKIDKMSNKKNCTMHNALLGGVVVPPRSWSIFFKISPRVFCFQPFLTKNI